MRLKTMKVFVERVNFKKIQLLIFAYEEDKSQVIYYTATKGTELGSKNKSNQFRKNFLIFLKMEPTDSKIKKFLIFSQKKIFLIFQKMEPCTFWP